MVSLPNLHSFGSEIWRLDDTHFLLNKENDSLLTETVFASWVLRFAFEKGVKFEELEMLLSLY